MSVNEEPASEERRVARFLLGLCRVIALHIVLVDAVVLQVDEYAIYKCHPESGVAEVCE